MSGRVPLAGIALGCGDAPGHSARVTAHYDDLIGKLDLPGKGTADVDVRLRPAMD